MNFQIDQQGRIISLTTPWFTLKVRKKSRFLLLDHQSVFWKECLLTSSEYGVLSDPNCHVFVWILRLTEWISIFSSKKGIYEPDKTPHFATWK